MKSRCLRKWLAGACLAAALGTMSTFAALAETESGGIVSPESAGWSKADAMTASWTKVEDATGYQLKLFRDGCYLRTVDSKKNKIDLSEYMTKEGDYYYEVRAVIKDTQNDSISARSEYILSDELELDDLGDTEGDWKHYITGKKYMKEDGTFAAGEWYKIQGTWYYFDETAHMATGWKQLGTTWYYLDADGAMQTGCLSLDGVTYYLKEDGSMVTGWLQYAPGTWCYFYESGAMAVNAVIDGYAVNENGIWRQN